MKVESISPNSIKIYFEVDIFNATVWKIIVNFIVLLFIPSLIILCFMTMEMYDKKGISFDFQCNFLNYIRINILVKRPLNPQRLI